MQAAQEQRKSDGKIECLRDSAGAVLGRLMHLLQVLPLCGTGAGVDCSVLKASDVSVKEVFLLSLHRGWCSERLSNLPEVTQLVIY